MSSVGKDEGVIRDYIRNHEEEDERLEQLNLWKKSAIDRRLNSTGAAVASPLKPL